MCRAPQVALRTGPGACPGHGAHLGSASRLLLTLSAACVGVGGATTSATAASSLPAARRALTITPGGAHRQQVIH